MDIRHTLHLATDRLAQAGCDSPRLDAELLLGYVLGFSRTQLYARWEQSLPFGQRRVYEELVQRRVAREPLAYITGRKEFFGLDFEVNRSVLVPRPETELLVEQAIQVARRISPDGTLRLADIGTGSGVIAVSLAVSLPEALVDAVDRSANALAVAARNCRRHDVASRIRLFQGDLMSPLLDPVDVVIANLPYVGHAELDTLAPEIRLFEPREALDGGDQGLDLIRRLFQQIRALPVRPQVVLLEIGSTQGEAVLNMSGEIFPKARSDLATGLCRPGSYCDGGVMSYKFLIMDVDDTLLPRTGDISERSKQAIRRAQEQGVLVTLASGRTFGSVSKFARELGIDLPLIAHQGALIKDPVSGQVLYEDLIPSEMMREVIGFSREHDLHLNLYMDDDVFVEKAGEELELYTVLSRKGGTSTPDLMVKLDRNPTKFIVVSATPERTEAILPVLKEAFSDHLSILRSHPLLIEGVMPTVSKGRALSMLARHLGVSQAETVAIGDNENDMEMLIWAGLGLAMGNAAPEVQAAADYVLPPIWEEGAAYGIEHYVLNGRK